MAKKPQVEEEPQMPAEEKATMAVEEVKPVADFVPRVTPPVRPEPRISNLTRASHAGWRRRLKVLRAMGWRPR